MKKSGKIQKSINAPKPEPKIKSDAVYNKTKTDKVGKELGDREQSYRKDSREVEKSQQSSKVGSDPK